MEFWRNDVGWKREETPDFRALSAELPTSPALPAKSPPWWLWLHVLSLEAPLVAVLWQMGLAKAHGLHLMPMVHAGLGLVVWIIYVLDRLWDTFRQPKAELDARHAFYRRHRVLFMVLILPLALAGAACIALKEIPEGILWQAVSLAVFVALYFFVYVARLAPALMPRPHAAALLFALGCTASIRFFSMPETWADPLLECAVLTLLFLANLSALAAKEEEDAGKPAHWHAAHPTLLGGNILVMVAVLYYIQKGSFDAVLLPPAIAVLFGLGLMTILHRFRGKLSVEQHRVLADLAMVLPLPVVWM